MKVLWIAFRYNTVEPWIESLNCLGQHESIVRWYTEMPAPMDREIMDEANRVRPDLIIYTGMADWNKTPSPATFARLRKMCPVVHLSGDLADPPWWPYLDEYRAQKSFTTTVNIDGNKNWPSGPNDLTLLSPTAPQFYKDKRHITERIIPFGFAGGYASQSRREIVEYCASNGMFIKPRNEVYGSYQIYADFMKECKIFLCVPFSGSDAVTQVKGKVLETGLAGGCLLDHVSSAAKDWFVPGEDYLEYQDARHAVGLVREVLRDTDKLVDIARNLHWKVTRFHGPEQFWGAVFKKL